MLTRTPFLHSAPRELDVFDTVRRLRLDCEIRPAEPELSDDFYEERGNEHSRNVLAEYLLYHAEHLESLEVTWAPIFTVKECLPRFACLSLFYTVYPPAPTWRGEEPSKPSDGPLGRNVRRLRAALRRQVLGEQPALPIVAFGRGAQPAAKGSKSSLTVDEIIAVANSEAFEKDDTWSSWLSDRTLMQQVAEAFNSCPWALHEDMPPNPADRDDCIRQFWPAPPYRHASSCACARCLGTQPAAARIDLRSDKAEPQVEHAEVSDRSDESDSTEEDAQDSDVEDDSERSEVFSDISCDHDAPMDFGDGVEHPYDSDCSNYDSDYSDYY